jgi:glycosyltransferase involved in cell wall biosynthesis
MKNKQLGQGEQLMQKPVVKPASSHPLEEPDSSPDAVRPPVSLSMPKVAAIVGNFNQKAYVEAAIASVMRQTYPHVECVVVDDCSTDGSAEEIARVLSAAGPKGRQFQFIRHTENRGQMAAMLTGLDATTAPFVAWLDADDIWFPEYIERHVAHHLNSQVNAAISTSNMVVIDAGGTVLAGADPSMSTASPIRKWDRTFPMRPAALAGQGKEIDFASTEFLGPAFVNRHYELWVWSPTSGMIFRRAAVEAVRPLRSEGLRTCADHYLARFSHVIGGTILMNETLGCYRVHGANAFAKRAVFGDIAFGAQPENVSEEGNYQFSVKLQESKNLIELLSRDDLPRLLREICSSPRIIRKILANKKLRHAIRLKQRVRFLRKNISARLRGSLKRFMGSGQQQ